MRTGAPKFASTIKRRQAGTAGGATSACTQHAHRRHDGLQVSWVPSEAPGRQPSSVVRTAAPLRSKTSSAQAAIWRTREVTSSLIYQTAKSPRLVIRRLTAGTGAHQAPVRRVGG
jgi:hypothetical protein